MYRWAYKVLSGCGLAIMQRRLSRSYNIPGMSGTSNSPAVATAVMAGGLTTLGMRLRFNMCSCIWLRLPKSLCTSASLLPDTVRLRALHSSLSLTTGSLLRSSIFIVLSLEISTLDDNQKWKWTFAAGHSRGVL
ncbi:hypothetical protein ORF095R [Spotted knifejaw iridovirus]|uniref:Uncharacterized protein n=4 Tax=Infectious spleen and kidney necrosis virus TaxID=180170 RepID=M1S0V5_ISKNV|nr:ORF86R [Orange-spotted grouper iridovirus]AGG37964.1 hypothetical protein [Rock bream iridovirus]AMM72719.1 ORF096R [giant sea perch iridovirus - K1]QND75891.1 hypothetical protein ORF106 [Red seabream iridovirus]WBR81571.1 hypothetical protein ORF095R [Spotted knifejaw iridovirus]